MKAHFEGLGRMAEWVHRSGDDIVGGINDESNGDRVRGYHVQRGNITITIESSESNTFATVAVVWRITNLLSGQIPKDQVDNCIEEIQPDEDTTRNDIRESIAHDYIDHHRDWVNERIEEIAQTEYGYESHLSLTPIPKENVVSDGFQITQRIYPQDETFRHRHYDQAVKEIVSELREVGEAASEGIEDVFSPLSDDGDQHVGGQAESLQRDGRRGTAYQ